MIRSMHLMEGAELRTELSRDEFREVIANGQGLLWVDIQKERRESVEPLLREVFGFHPLAIDDALDETHVPKVDDWGSYLYVVLHGVLNSTLDREDRLETDEIDIFAGSRYIVTFQDHPIPAVDRVWEVVQRDQRVLAQGAGHLLYRIIDETESDYLTLLDSIDEKLSRIEDEIFANPEPALLSEVFSLKRVLLRIRRGIAPQREVINKLARGDFQQFSPEDRMYFRDVYDHLVRLNDILESLRDLVGSALEIYLSVVSNRLNDVLKTLTIITTLFMPLTFIAGFFGMNFFQATDLFASWTGRLSFVTVIGLMVATPILMYTWMRRRAWV
ncbi:MAG TPA: magnesium/cobalt transporter CorA [Anaerolineales bacterium]